MFYKKMLFLTFLVIFLSYLTMKMVIQRRKIFKFASAFSIPSPRHPIMGHLLLFPKDPVGKSIRYIIKMYLSLSEIL